MGITIEQLVDIVQSELTISGLFPKVLPDIEIQRIIKEHALEWFYKNYIYATIKTYYYMKKECFTTDVYTKYKYFILPQEIESVVRIIKVDNPSLLRIGIQAPHLSINLGVVNQPILTSYLTTIGELAVYRSIISALADEVNKMVRRTVKFKFNHINKRLHILTNIDSDLILEVYVRIEQEELFDSQIFKDYVIGLSKVRMGEALSRFNFSLPGDFQYNASDIISRGQEMVDKVVEKVKGISTSNWFIMNT